MRRRLFLITTCFLVCTSWIMAQTRTITGVVISEGDAEPVIGASVLVSGTTIGTVTNLDGEFTIPDVPGSAKIIRVSYIGMQTQEVSITDNMRIVLKPDSEMLEEVVVLGYGSARKLGSVVGSVGTISNSKLKQQPAANFSDALQGQVAGLSVLSSSGEPTATASIRLRGVNSISASIEPLFILDGSPVTAVIFNSMNPNDIENITVLKDASSTAIYGSRAANGVIVITSKKGKMGEKARVAFRAQYGFSSLVGDRVTMMNSNQYMAFREMLSPSLADDKDWITHKQVVQDNNINTDWSKYVYNDNAPTYNADLTISGGGNNNSYYLSLSHNSTEGIAPLSEMHRTALRSNLEIRANDWLKVGLNSNLSFMKYNENPDVNVANGMSETNPAQFARFARPDDSPYYYTVDENGKAIFGNRADYLHYSKFLNPLFVESYRDRNRQNLSANINLYEEIRPVNGLILRAAQSLDGFDYTYSSNVPPIINFTTPMGDNVEINNGSGQARELFQRFYRFTFTNTAEYKFNVENIHDVTLLLGQEAILSKDKSFDVTTSGQNDGRLMMLVNGTNYQAPVDGILESVFNSVFFRADYAYKDKYFLDASYRVDGSSKFSPNHRWAEFYSLGAKWNMKKESFIKDIKWLDDLAVRVSYGTTGNSNIGDYRYYSLLSSDKISYEGQNGTIIVQPGNKNLTWETIKAANFGVDFRLFDRISGSIEYYNKKTEDMLMFIPYSYTSGFNGSMGNMGAMTNKGIELSFNVDLLKTKDIYWGFRGNLNYNKNEITELFNGLSEYEIPETGSKFQVGKSFGELYMVKRAGVDPRDGKIMWYDKYGNKTKTYSEDHAVFSGKSQFAPWIGGFGSSFTWKGLTVSADFSFALEKYTINNERYFLENPYEFGSTYNQSTKVLNMWTTPGQVTDIPAASEKIYIDDYFMENASFLRLKNVSVSYSFPEKIIKKTKLFDSLNVFATGRNLLTITKFKGYDPEAETNAMLFKYPNTRQYVFGFEVSF